jgi:hypothetical protein
MPHTEIADETLFKGLHFSPYNPDEAQLLKQQQSKKKKGFRL